MVKKAIKCESNGVVVYSSQSCHRSGKERLVEKLGQKWIISGSHNFPILKIFFYIKNPPPTILKHWWLLPLWQAESGNLREWKFWENNFSSKTQYWTGKCFQRVKMKTLYNVMYMYIVHCTFFSLSSILCQLRQELSKSKKQLKGNGELFQLKMKKDFVDMINI